MTAFRLGRLARVALAIGVTTFYQATAMAQTTFRNNLMPQPADLSTGTGSLALRSTFAVQTPGVSGPRLTSAIDRTVVRIEQIAGLRHAGRGVLGTTPLIVKVNRAAAPVQTFDEDESYTLTVTASAIQIDAPSELGALHGLQTLIQLIQPSGPGYIIPAVTIHDTPRFHWRGLMIDCGRHFEPVAVIKRTLDGMAAVKLNVFHWHLTEDQGFRMESHLYPRLTEVGSDGLFYTQDEAKSIVAYARARGIRVVPEFEMPGHSAAWLLAYPELNSGTAAEGIRREFGVSDTAIDPTREATYTFIARFLGEMATIFPDDYVHIGGDETPAPDWKKNPRILAFMKAHNLANNDALQAYFNTRILKILAGLHKHMMGWDEILTPALPKDIVIQSWRGQESLFQGARLGYEGVLSAPYYLDGMQPASNYYLADPLPSSSDLTPAQRSLILGGEVCMWAEHLDARNIDSRIWPRTAAIAERFWSPENVRDVDDMYRRLLPTSLELEALGLTHLQSEDTGLRGLAGTENIDALRTFASAFEPLSFGERASTQHTDQLTPLDNFVDAVRPDRPSRHWFESAVKRFLANPKGDTADRVALDTFFQQLAGSVPTVRQQMLTSPRLAETSTRAEQLLQLTAAGQQALQYLAEGQQPPAGWATQQQALLEEANKPSAFVHFSLTPSLKDLITAAGKSVAAN